MLKIVFNKFFNNLDTKIISRFWNDWFLQYRSKFFFTVLLMILVAISGSIYPVLIKHLFDVLTGGAGELYFASFIYIPLAIILLTFVKAVSMYFQIIMVNSLSLKITTNIQKRMFSKLIDSDLYQILSKPVGSLVSRIMNDLNILRETIVRLVNNLIRDVLTIIVMICMLFWFNWMLSLVILAIYPIAIRPIILIGVQQRKASSELQEHLSKITSNLSESFQGIRMVKSFQLEKYEKRRNHRSFDTLYKRLLKLLSGRAKIDPILESLGGVVIAVVVLVAVWQISNENIKVGDIAGFITALLMMVQPLRGLGTLNAVGQEGIAAIERIFFILDKKNKIKNVKNAKDIKIIKGKISFQNVFFKYDKKIILNNISFDVNSGEKVAIVGVSGAGKSTIINLLPRFFDITKGKIMIDDTNISDVTISSLRSKISLVSQETFLFEDTIMANIGFGLPRANKYNIIKSAKMAAAHKFISNLNDGYLTNVGTSGFILSQGQKQRISIARAILKNSPILLLDEATSSLDTDSENQIQVSLDNLSKGKTTIIIAHRLSTIKNADKIIVLDKGKIVESGTHEKLSKKRGYYYNLLKKQKV